MFGAVARTAEFRMGDRNQVVEQNNSFHTRRLQLNQGRRLVQRGVAHVKIEIGGRRRDDMARTEKLFKHPASVRRLLERRRRRRADHRLVRANRRGQRGQQPRLVRRITRRIRSPVPPRPQFADEPAEPLGVDRHQSVLAAPHRYGDDVGAGQQPFGIGQTDPIDSRGGGAVGPAHQPAGVVEDSHDRGVRRRSRPASVRRCGRWRSAGRPRRQTGWRSCSRSADRRRRSSARPDRR